MGTKVKKVDNYIRKYSRKVHAHLSYFFVGVILIYAISGLTMNHLKDFNPQYMLSVTEYRAEGKYPHKHDFSKEQVRGLLRKVGEDDNYTKHYYPNQSTMKVFLKNGSSFGLDTETGNVKYEALKKRPFFSQLSSLHYNPNKWWTLFSDIFACSLITICLTGILMNKGKKGIMGVGGIEMLCGIIVPILMLIFM